MNFICSHHKECISLICGHKKEHKEVTEQDEDIPCKWVRDCAGPTKIPGKLCKVKCTPVQIDKLNREVKEK